MQNDFIDQGPPFSPSRRQFLRTGTAAAFGLGLPSLGWLTGCASLPDTRALPWSDLARSMQGPLLMPGSPEFAARAHVRDRGRRHLSLGAHRAHHVRGVGT